MAKSAVSKGVCSIHLSSSKWRREETEGKKPESKAGELLLFLAEKKRKKDSSRQVPILCGAARYKSR